MKPTKLRLKPVEVEAMQFNGDNAEEIIEWVRKTDGFATYRCDVVLPAAHLGFAFGDGSTVVRAVSVPYMEIHNFAYSFRVWMGGWIFKGPSGSFSPHLDAEVKSKYERVEEES